LVLPTPEDAKLSVFGLARARATKSASVLIGASAPTTSTFGNTATDVIGANALVGSYGND
jgi:hypothetical protein